MYLQQKRTTRRSLLLKALIVMPLGVLGGCAMWDLDRFDLDRYRDERAVDIESNLSREKPIVQNPF